MVCVPDVYSTSAAAATWKVPPLLVPPALNRSVPVTISRAPPVLLNLTPTVDKPLPVFRSVPLLLIAGDPALVLNEPALIS